MLVPESERATSLAKLDDRLGGRLGARQSAVGAGGRHSDWRASPAFIGISSGIVALLVWRSVPAKVEVPPLNWIRWFEVLRSPALADGRDCAYQRRRQRYAELHRADREKAVQGITAGARGAVVPTTGVGGLLGNLLSVRLIRRIGANYVALQMQRNFGSRVVALAARCELDSPRDLRQQSSGMESRAWQCWFPSRAAGTAGMVAPLLAAATTR